MTLLEIMIVLAILALVMGFLVGPKIWKQFSDSKEDAQRMLVKQYANDGWISWQRRHPGGGCPSSIDEISVEMARVDKEGKPNSMDQWGQPLKFFCGANLPPAAQVVGFAVYSVGKDGQDGTADDIKSWE